MTWEHLMRSQALMLIIRRLISGLSHAAATSRLVLADFGRWPALCGRSRGALAAKNVFLRKQLALFHERTGKPRRATGATRFPMSLETSEARPERRG
jgi:hypothetical protein